MSAEIVLPTARDTQAFGVRLAALLRAGDLVVLTGELGAGKTTFTQGLGEGLGIRGPVTSPTFVIARVHPSRRPGGGPALVHVDAYRLGSALEFDDLDLDADLGGSVVVVEWGEGLVEGLAGDRLHLRLVADGDARRLTVTPVGPRWRSALTELTAALAQVTADLDQLTPGVVEPTAAPDQPPQQPAGDRVSTPEQTGG